MDDSRRVAVNTHPFPCPGSSQAFPARLDCLVYAEEQADQAFFHWRADDSGWEPCLTAEPKWLQLQHLAIELGLEFTPFEAHNAAARSAAAEFSQLGIEHWRLTFVQAVDRELARAENQLGRNLAKVEVARTALLLAEYHAITARIGNPALASAAYRLLAQDWAGTPAELLATAEAVLEA